MRTRKTLFTADIHLFHQSIMRFCPETRPYKCKTEMSEALRDRWNQQVAPDDQVYLIGDVSWGNFKETQKLLHELNGEIHLILGNHDKRMRLQNMNRFSSIQNYLEININKNHFCLFHYPIYEWNRIHHGSIHLYGHVHGRELTDLPEGKSMDVGIDTRPGFKLYTYKEIMDIMKDKPVRKHHG